MKNQRRILILTALIFVIFCTVFGWQYRTHKKDIRQNQQAIEQAQIELRQATEQREEERRLSKQPKVRHLHAVLRTNDAGEWWV